jgi:hypothetical protein
MFLLEMLNYSGMTKNEFTEQRLTEDRCKKRRSL